MPVFSINTNVSAEKVPKDFKAKATTLIAETLGKPASYVAVHIKAGQDLSLGGSDEPAAVCELMSIGCLSKELNKTHSRTIMEFLESSLNLNSKRIYITFINQNKADIGYDKTTFDDLI